LKRIWTGMNDKVISLLYFHRFIFIYERNGNGVVTFLEFVLFYEKGLYKEYL
jgi:hypothetical protein